MEAIRRSTRHTASESQNSSSRRLAFTLEALEALGHTLNYGSVSQVGLPEEQPPLRPTINRASL